MSMQQVSRSFRAAGVMAPGASGSSGAAAPHPRAATLAVAVLAAAALAGCATARRLDSDVASFGSWPQGRAPATFAFERLPSQQAQPERQAQVEDAALTALEGAGFRPAAAGAQADALVQVAARTLRYDRGYYGDPFLGGAGFYGRGGRWHGGGMGYGFGYGWGSSYYVNEVSLLIRDGRTQQPLYETRARSDGLWADVAVQAALFEAAMKDFPQQAVSPRRVTVEIPPPR